MTFEEAQIVLEEAQDYWQPRALNLYQLGGSLGALADRWASMDTDESPIDSSVEAAISCLSTNSPWPPLTSEAATVLLHRLHFATNAMSLLVAWYRLLAQPEPVLSREKLLQWACSDAWTSAGFCTMSYILEELAQGRFPADDICDKN